MRREPTIKRSNSTHSDKLRTLPDALREIDALKLRVTKLERRKSIDDYEDGWKSETPTKKRGPKPKHSQMLFRKRDELIATLEWNWPALEPTCVPAVKAKALREVLLPLSLNLNLGRQQQDARHLLDNFSVLLDFLRSDRFRDDPRQIANAMIGVPDVSWWRSLKVCQAKRSQVAMSPNAMKSYVRRKHRRLYDTLELDPRNLLHFIRVLKHYASRDPHMWAYKRWPKRLLHSWGQQG